jgi:hypothetical protein
LFAYSEAVKLDWDSKIKEKGLILSRLFRKQITVVRNGIYLDRLPKDMPTKESPPRDTRPRLIYLGRNAIWKGLGTYFELMNHEEFNGFDFLLIVPSIEGIPNETLEKNKSRLSVIEGKTFSDIQKYAGDVHIYATNYGSCVDIVESVSLNVLEFASIGVPSLISKHGSSTWPELVTIGLLKEVDWSNLLEVSEAIRNATAFTLNAVELETVRNIISVQANLKRIAEISSISLEC